MTNSSIVSGPGLDIEAVLAQVDAGVAGRDTVMTALAQLVSNDKPIPLTIEAAALKFYIEEDASRIDLKRRLATVMTLLGQPIDEALTAEVRASMISQEHETDFQSMLDEYGRNAKFADMEPEFKQILELVRPYTMTTIERLHALWSSVGYVAAARIPGDIVECGVWRGGSMMLAALELVRRGATDRELWLFDTFAGLPKPDAEIDIDVMGNRAIDGWNAHTLADGKTYWAYADEADVRRNMGLTRYPNRRLHFVPGLVEESIPKIGPSSIALLRIDTDWYSSYKHVLHEMYDRVVPGGIVIFDDYGHFGGARKAVDEFVAERGITSPLIRIDYSCRMMMKLGMVQPMPEAGPLTRIARALGLR
ncbi:TylF/MycF/NovP-related O-methyltransferase [Bosea sp. (in: a-proteobacteria)]|uniref:TylF/MycF/NovP-related O-methyltransferase n=1 Tax=Bosea sp. (in: a-proteobacteria) TaxID=1871050 RepID=UPI004033E9E2